MGQPVAILAFFEITLTAGCSESISTGMGLPSEDIPSYVCEMVVTDLRFALDEVTDTFESQPDEYRIRALEVVFDMTSDSLALYAQNSSGLGADYLEDLSDRSDTLGDLIAQENLDMDQIVPQMEGFVSKMNELGEFCG